MDTNLKKLKILDSLRQMDQAQMDKVLEYVNDLLGPEDSNRARKELRKRAMREIRQALRH
jgi:hypothetical protein